MIPAPAFALLIFGCMSNHSSLGSKNVYGACFPMQIWKGFKSLDARSECLDGGAAG
jgi:hypothetical protein